MLLSFNKKKSGEDKRLSAHESSSAEMAEFIPYYCHYNPHTILTKNGELLQVFKIATNLAGLDYESGYAANSIVREAIRRAIREHVSTDSVAIWFHTMRKRKSIRYPGKFKEDFAAQVHEKWQKTHRWKFQYYNEVYVSVLHEGQSAAMMDTKNLKNVMLHKRNRDFRNAYLDVVSEELDTIVDAMTGSISQSFNVQRLTIVERVPQQEDLPVNQAVFYSEPMEFLSTLVNLRAESVLLPDMDISKAMASTIQTFGFNAMETRNEAGRRRFAAILTLKQYREVPLETIDRLLQVPMEFIVSQSFHFIPAIGALRQYKEQKQLFDISGDDYCIEASGINDMMSSQSGMPTDFGEHQTSIMVLADEFKQLDGQVVAVQAAFADLGLITIREDVKLEECFWSQLPANFEFIRRRDTINTSRIGGFCRLNRYPQGIATGNHWGDALTIFPTLVGSPYFFNLHYQDNGHTIVYDFNSFGDQCCNDLINFLLSEARKYDNRCYVFDRRRSAELLFQKLGGNYYNFTALSRTHDEVASSFNPFTLPDNPRNRSFLVAWCGMLIAPELGLSENQKQRIRDALEKLYSGDPQMRTLPGLVACLAPVDPALAKAFGKWHSEGVYAGMFDGPTENFNTQHSLHAFDMTPVIKNKECIVPVFAYLLHRIVTSVDGRPTLIVLYDALDLLENSFIAPRLESLLEMLQQNNTAVIFTTSKPAQSVSTYVFNGIVKNCVSQIILPDDISREYTAIKELGITEFEEKRLIRMDRQKGEFLLKQNGETIALRAYLKALDDLYAVLSNDSKNLAAALGKFSA